MSDLSIEPHRGPPAVEPRQTTILLVDDEFDLRYVTRLLLEGAGYRVVEAANGQHALDQLADVGPDLVLTDVDMPGMDGLELFEVLRTDPRTSELPVLVWSERPPSGLPDEFVHAKGSGITKLIAHIGLLLEGLS